MSDDSIEVRVRSWVNVIAGPEARFPAETVTDGNVCAAFDSDGNLSIWVTNASENDISIPAADVESLFNVIAFLRAATSHAP